MNPANILLAAGGVGIFMFSLRYLNVILQRSIARRLRPVINRMLSRPWRCLLLGLLMTVLVQASSITIVASMGLVSSGLVALEQAWYLMLGATVGTTVKAWLFAGGLQYAPVFIVVATLLRWTGRQPFRREMADILFAVGMSFLGLSMLAQGLDPILKESWVQPLLQLTGAEHGLAAELQPMVLGCLLSVAVQSSSALVILTISLAGQGFLSFTTGAALIIGMNVGTTSTELLASVEASREGRALAIGHCLVKALGACGVLLTFPFYMGFLDAAINLVAPGAGLGVRLATVHTVFNVGNAVFWSFFAGPAVRFLTRYSGPRPPAMGLAVAVRRILSQAPDLAILELERQVTNLLNLMKVIQDRTVTHLTSHGGIPSGQEDAFAALEETLADLLFGLTRRDAARDSARMTRALKVLGCCQHLFAQWQMMEEHLERAQEGSGPILPEPLHYVLSALVERWDRIWLHILFPDRVQVEPKRGDPGEFTNAFLHFCNAQHGLTSETARWVLDTAGLLTSIDAGMRQLEFEALATAASAPSPHHDTEVDMDAQADNQADRDAAVATVPNEEVGV